MFKKSSKTRRNRSSRLTFETMERRELMTANLGMAMEPVETPIAVAPAIVAYELTYLNNDTMAGATSMGTLSTSATASGSVGGTDPRDFWKFRVANSGATTIRLAGMSRDVDVQILDSSGRVLASGTNGGTSSESLTVNLQAGVDYFIKVYPYSSGGVTNYQLSVDVPTPPSNGNDTMAGATPLGTVTTSVTASGTVGGTDPRDFWKFRVANSGATTIQLAGMSRDLDIQILDSSGRVLASGTNGGTNSESLTVNLLAGVDYFIKVYPYTSGGVSSYQLSVNAPAPNVDPDTGVIPLGTVATSVTVSNSVGGADLMDRFTFRVASGGATTIQLAGMSRDVDILILDPSGRILASGTNGGTSSESLTVNLQAGVDYFIKVYPLGSGPTTSYQLTINAPTERSDDTASGAQPLGSVYNTRRTVYGRVGGSDPVDYFSFTHSPISGTGAPNRLVLINLTGMTADLDLQVVDSLGNIVGTSSRGGTTSESLTLNLATGRQYFIRVFPYGSGTSNYSLSVSS